MATVSTKLWEPEVLCHDNLWFPGWELSVPTFGNRKFFAMVTYGSQVGNFQFQPLGNWHLLAMVTYGAQVGNYQIQPLGSGSCLHWSPLVPMLATVPGTKRKHSGIGPLSKTKRSAPDHPAKQSVLYRTIKQNKALCTRPISKTKRSASVH